MESVVQLSKYFDESGHGPSLFIFDKSTGRLTEVSRYTPLYKQYSGRVKLSRLYVRPDQIDQARAILADRVVPSSSEGEP